MSLLYNLSINRRTFDHSCCMELREQIESDLRNLASSSLPSNVKKLMDQVISRLKSKSPLFEIKDANDPFVLLFEEITKDKRLITESAAILSAIRSLLENGAIDGKACAKVFSIIDSMIHSAPEQFLLKVLQISLASFASPSKNLETRITASRWIFQMAESTQFQIIPHIATATAYQLLDIAFDRAMGNTETKMNSISPQNSMSADIDNTAELLVNQNAEQASDNEMQGNQEELDTLKKDSSFISDSHFDPNDWSITFIFSLTNDLLLFMNNSEPKMFKNTFNKSNFPLLLLKYILDRHFAFLSKTIFQPKFKVIIDMIYNFIISQSDPIRFSMFVPHMVVNFAKTEPKKYIPLFTKLVSLIESYPCLINAASVTIAQMPSLQFVEIPSEDLMKLAHFSSKLFTSNFKGVLSEPIVVFGSNVPKLSSYDPFDQSMSKILVSSVIILYNEILQCSHNSERFIYIYDLFEGVWQRVIQTTQDPVTLGTSLKLARQCVRFSIRQKQYDPAQRIFSTLCGFAVPNSAAYSLVAKGVIALHSIIRLLQQMKAQLAVFWPLIFETISKCHHTASHKRSTTDSQALKLIQPKLVSFSTELSDDLLRQLFTVILKLSDDENKTFITRKGTVPNFWPLKTLAYIFELNVSRESIIEEEFFNHLCYLIQCDSSEFRIRASSLLFQISKAAINSKVSTKKCKQKIFDSIFQAANSIHRDVSIAAFNNLLSFLTGGTAVNIEDGWPMILTILKVVWATPYPENLQNGFRVLTFVCSDCLIYLKSTDIEVCLSTISAYIVQTEDINIALGTIGLLWNIGSSLSPDNSLLWKLLFKTLQSSFSDKRHNIRESALQTFFSLVNTFSSQFAEELRIYVLENVISPLVSIIPQNNSPLLAIQGIIQCLRSLGDYDGIIDKLICSMESISTQFERGIKAGEAARCYIPLFFFDDSNVSKKVAISFQKVVEKYTLNPTKSDLQGAVSVVTDVFPKIANKIDDDEFDCWIEILRLFCSFQIDKPFLHVSTIAALNVQERIPSLNESRIIKLIKLNTKLIDLGCQPLTAKCFDLLALLYVNELNDDGRANCFIQILPILQRMLATNECAVCFRKLINSPISYDIVLTNNATVIKLVEIGRRIPSFKNSIVKLISTKMNIIHPDIFPIFLSLGKDSPILFQLYFENFCSLSLNDTGFFQKTNVLVKESIDEFVNILINEERALDMILRKQQYQEIINFFSKLKDLETSPELFHTNGTKGHLSFLLKPIIKLSETKSAELRNVIQEILHIITM